MTIMTKGQRFPLSVLITSGRFSLSFDIKASAPIDVVCFGVDVQGKLSDDRYMVFFNQPETPCKSLRLQQPGIFDIDLAGIPAQIDRLVFTAAMDGAGGMRDIGNSTVQLIESGQEKARCEFSGMQFAAEKALMLVELYRKAGEWRINTILQGFNEGLAALVAHFGGSVAEEPAAPAKVSLEKKIAAAAPKLVNLAKKAQVSLEKAKLTGVRARVGLVLDASGSMIKQYRDGRVQEVVDRLIPLAVHFDDNGALDCWAFAEDPQQLSSVTLQNHAQFIKTDHEGWQNWNLGARINNEPRVMEQVIDFYEQSGERIPVYVLFISDGGISENRRITALMLRAARLPIFWQFVGIGGRNYGILETLDDMPGRVIDNCNFFALDDLHDISEEALYEKLTGEFPDWLKAARQANIID